MVSLAFGAENWDTGRLFPLPIKKKKNRFDGFIYVKVDSDTGRILLDYLGLFIKLLLAVCIGLALSVISVDFVWTKQWKMCSWLISGIQPSNGKWVIFVEFFFFFSSVENIFWLNMYYVETNRASLLDLFSFSLIKLFLIIKNGDICNSFYLLWSLCSALPSFLLSCTAVLCIFWTV